MFGQVVMVERMMIVIVMAMQHRCGQYRLILLSMMVEQHSMMNHVLRHWLLLSVMDEVMILKQVCPTKLHPIEQEENVHENSITCFFD